MGVSWSTVWSETTWFLSHSMRGFWKTIGVWSCILGGGALVTRLVGVWTPAWALVGELALLATALGASLLTQSSVRQFEETVAENLRLKGPAIKREKERRIKNVFDPFPEWRPRFPRDQVERFWESLALALVSIAGSTVLFGMVLHDWTRLGFRGFAGVDGAGLGTWIRYAVDNLAEACLFDAPTVYGFHWTGVHPKVAGAQHAVFAFRAGVDFVLLKALVSLVRMGHRMRQSLDGWSGP